MAILVIPLSQSPSTIETNSIEVELLTIETRWISTSFIIYSIFNVNLYNAIFINVAQPAYLPIFPSLPRNQLTFYLVILNLVEQSSDIWVAFGVYGILLGLFIRQHEWHGSGDCEVAQGEHGSFGGEGCVHDGKESW